MGFLRPAQGRGREHDSLRGDAKANLAAEGVHPVFVVDDQDGRGGFGLDGAAPGGIELGKPCPVRRPQSILVVYLEDVRAEFEGNGGGLVALGHDAGKDHLGIRILRAWTCPIVKGTGGKCDRGERNGENPRRARPLHHSTISVFVPFVKTNGEARSLLH